MDFQSKSCGWRWLFDKLVFQHQNPVWSLWIICGSCHHLHLVICQKHFSIISERSIHGTVLSWCRIERYASLDFCEPECIDLQRKMHTFKKKMQYTINGQKMYVSRMRYIHDGRSVLIDASGWVDFGFRNISLYRKWIRRSNCLASSIHHTFAP